MRYFIPISNSFPSRIITLVVFKNTEDIGTVHVLPGYHGWRCNLNNILQGIERKEWKEIGAAEAALIS